MSEPGPTPRARLLGFAAAALYLGLAIPYAALWSPAHDEGVTWRQSLGRAALPTVPAPPIAISALYDFIDGRDPHGLGDLATALTQKGGMHPPAYYALVRSLAYRLGTGRLAARAPLVLLGLVTLAAFSWLARELVAQPDAGGWAALLLASSPWFVGYSCFLRPYALALCLGVGSTALLVSGLADRRHRSWPLVFASLGVAGLLTLYHYVFVLIWQGAFWALHALALEGAARRQTLLRLAAAAALVALGFSPWLGHFAAQLAATGEADYYFAGLAPLASWPSLTARTLEIFTLAEALRGPHVDALRAAAIVLGLATGGGLFVQLRRAAPTAFPMRAFWLSLPVLPAGVALCDLWLDSHTLFISKTVFLALPLGMLGVVAVWRGAPALRLGPAVLAAFALLGAAANASILTTVLPLPTPVGLAAQGIRGSDGPRQVVALSSSQAGGVFPLLHAFRDAGVSQSRVVVVPARRLGPAVEGWLSGGRLDRVTLIDIDTRGTGRGQWSPAQLRALAGAARAAGWEVVRTPSAPPASSSGRPRLWILPTLQARFFAM